MYHTLDVLLISDPYFETFLDMLFAILQCELLLSQHIVVMANKQ